MCAAVDQVSRAPAAGDPTAGPGAPEGPDEHHVPVTTLRGPWLVGVGVATVAAVAAGVVLRFWTHSALWLDEALTVDIARLPLSRLHAALREDGAPPLYYVMLHFWIRWFGSSDFAVRSLSGVVSVATIPVVWVAGRRFAGRSVAWVAAVLLATAPFAIYYGTEARMYALVMFLTACGFIAVDRALTRPRPGNLIAVAVVAAALLYAQYWAVYLLAVVGLWLVFQAWRGREAWRANARWAIGAVVCGGLAFLPWVPTFYFQTRNTGTPWAAPPNFAAVISAVTGFTDNQATNQLNGTDQGRLLAVCYFVLAFLALFGMARDRWHIVLDIRTRPPARALCWVVGGTLGLAITGGILTQSAFSPRYAAVIFVPLTLVVAVGALTLVDVRVRTILVAVAAVAGLAAGVQNVYTQRTQAPPVAAVLAQRARPGDIVAYCPDQLGPSVARLLPADRYRMLTFPRGTSPEFVNWIDYLSVARASNPNAFARQLERLAAAGGGHTIWLVWDPGYQGFSDKCEQLAGDLLTAPGYGAHTWVNRAPKVYYEPMTLSQFNPPQLVPHPAAARTAPAPATP
jgi:mannosyltransferase